MFDLEKSIVEWRTQMAAAGITAPALLEELELHLRDEIEQQMKAGVGEPKAFEVAAAKVGPAGPLTREFQKISLLGGTPRQKRAAAVAFGFIIGFYSLVVTGILFKSDFTFGERMSGLASVATMLVLVFIAWQILPRFFPAVTGKAGQSMLGLVGGISGMSWFFVFVCFILPRCDFTLGQLRVAVFWAIVPVLVLPTATFLVLGKNEGQTPATTKS